jgi:hypothetical protein
MTIPIVMATAEVNNMDVESAIPDQQQDKKVGD